MCILDVLFTLVWKKTSRESKNHST